MNAPLFRPEAVRHQRERLWGNVILTQPLSMRLVTLVVLVVLVALIAYLTWGTYTRKERVRGYLVPEAGLVQVYPARPGTAVDILLEPGDVVKAGDTLARVRTDRTLRNGKGMNAELVHTLEEQAQLLKRRIDRARQRKEERRKHLEKKIANARAKIEQLRAQLTLQKERVALTRARYSALKTLHQEQLISQSDYQARYQMLLDERQKRGQLERSLLSERAGLQSSQFELSSLDEEVAETVDQLRAERARIKEQIIQYSGEGSFSIKAPISGQVTAMQAARGQKVNPQQPMMAILPADEDLRADLFVPTRAIGFVETGLPVEIRYDAFPYERFGVYDAQVERIARTVLSPRDVDAPFRIEEPVYRLRAALDHEQVLAYGRQFPLQAGMMFEADILLDERPLYQWILKPLYSLKGTL
jgi:membrane fusion protein